VPGAGTRVRSAVLSRLPFDFRPPDYEFCVKCTSAAADAWLQELGLERTLQSSPVSPLFFDHQTVSFPPVVQTALTDSIF
ncbi:hypothetical protein FRC10_004714, partial [Ceratobasidium sp. 414]